MTEMTSTRFAPFSAKRLRRQGFSSHSALALQLEDTSLKLPG